MPLETANYIFDLVPTNPPDTDLVQQGDDHIRLIKKVIQQTWPGLTGPNLPTSTGSANAHIVTHVYGPAAYVAGQIVTFKAGFTNTGPTTINVNGGGPVTLSQGGAALTANALVAGNNYTMIYDPSVTGFALIASSMGYLPLFGGTLSGGLAINAINALTINSPAGVQAAIVLNKAASGQQNQIWGRTAGSNRWLLNFGNAGAESGANAGSDLALLNYDDTGANIGVPLAVTRATGAVTLTGALSISPAATDATLSLQRATTSNGNFIQGYTGSSLRWRVILGNAVAESGSNVGSDFYISRFTDAGAGIDSPLIITRSTGQVTIAANLTVNSGNIYSGNGTTSTYANLFLNKAVGAYAAQITSQRNGVGRWLLQLGDASAETGSNVGSNYVIQCNTDAGGYLGQPLWIARNTQIATFSQPIVNGSDRRLKEDFSPIQDALAKVLKLTGVDYHRIGTAEDRREIGLIAQDVLPIVPEVVHETGTPPDAEGKPREDVTEPYLGVSYPQLTALLIEAMKTLTARVESLETQLGV